jgi:hypothetical protein
MNKKAMRAQDRSSPPATTNYNTKQAEAYVPEFTPQASRGEQSARSIGSMPSP